MVVSNRNLLFQGAPIFRGELLVSGRLCWAKLHRSFRSIWKVTGKPSWWEKGTLLYPKKQVGGFNPFESIWKKYYSNWIISPGRDEHKKHIWNHFVTPPKKKMIPGKFNSEFTPENQPGPKRKFIFQPSIFREGSQLLLPRSPMSTNSKLIEFTCWDPIWKNTTRERKKTSTNMSPTKTTFSCCQTSKILNNQFGSIWFDIIHSHLQSKDQGKFFLQTEHWRMDTQNEGECFEKGKSFWRIFKPKRTGYQHFLQEKNARSNRQCRPSDFEDSGVRINFTHFWDEKYSNKYSIPNRK